MSYDGRTGWEQPDFQSSLEAIAVDLITARAQQVFRELDSLGLVSAAHPELSPEERTRVAGLIDSAVVELVVDFGTSSSRTSMADR